MKKVIVILLSIAILSCSEEKTECIELSYDKVDNTEIGCFWKYTDWSNSETFTLIDCTDERDSYLRWQEQRCDPDAYLMAWTPKDHMSGLTCNCD